MFARSAAQKRAISPIVALPSGEFDGIDGNWSSFKVRVGTPGQYSRVLVSTTVPETWVIYSSACDAGANSNPECPNSRGGDPDLFNSNDSSTWDFQHGYTLGAETQLGIDSSTAGNYGYDTLALEASTNNGGVALANQVIAEIGSTSFWLGNLGLANRVVPFGNNTQAGYLTSLFYGNQIPSLSYSYTAGSFYNGKTNASLVLGGYDTSRFKDSGVSFQMGQDSTGGTNNFNGLQVGVQSIDYSDNTGTKTNLMNSGVLSVIDTTLPNIWLPQDACNNFASAFGLILNTYTQQYVINDTQRMANYRNGASVNFTLGASISGGSTVVINLPYAAFDLNYTNPTSANPNATQYFPLRVASQANQYTLGRAFFQEAVLTVDYGRGNFSVNQAIPVSSSKQSVVSILNGTFVSTSGPGGSGSGGSSSGSSGGSRKGKSSAGAIAGGVVGGIAAIVLLIAVFLWWRKRKVAAAAKAKEASSNADSNSGNAHFEQVNDMAQIKGTTSPPPRYPGPTDYFGGAAKDGITPAGTPGASASPHLHGLGIAQQQQQQHNPHHSYAAPEAASPQITPPAGATINNLDFQNPYNAAYLAPNAVPAGAAGLTGAGAAAYRAELQGSDANAMAHELHSPASRSELDTHAPRSELASHDQPRSELWTPVSATHSASPAAVSPHLDAVAEQPGELSGESTAAGLAGASGGASGWQSQSQRSSSTIPANMQPGMHHTSFASTDTASSGGGSGMHAIPPLPPNAATNITAAELATRPMSTATTFFSESATTPSPGEHGAGQTGYFSSNTSVAGSEVTGLSRGPSIMSATSVAISGTGRPNMVTHVRRGSDNETTPVGTRRPGFEPIGEEEQETEANREAQVVSRDGSEESETPRS